MRRFQDCPHYMRQSYVLVQTEANADSEVDGTVTAAEMLSGHVQTVARTRFRHVKKYFSQ